MFQIARQTAGGQEAIRLFETDGQGETGASASILPGYGFNCFSFRCNVGGRPVDLLHASETFPSENDPPTRNGTPVLVPFPNRIRAGKFRYRGQDFVVRCNEHGKNAIHGFAFDHPWRIAKESADEQSAEVVGLFELSQDRPDFASQWPADFRVSFRYRLESSSLLSEIEVENPSDRVLPFGVGTHPYFRFPLLPTGTLDQCEIVSPVGKQVELQECLPTGVVKQSEVAATLSQGCRLSSQTFDDVFGDLTLGLDGKVHHFLRDFDAKVELEIVHDREFPYVVIFTPPHRKAVCIEPYTCLTDAINLESETFETGLWHLHPGEIRRLSIEYRVRPLE